MNEPQRFRKRPVEVEAVQWDGTAIGADSVIRWILASGGTAKYACLDTDTCLNEREDAGHTIAIETLEGTMNAVADDWIIRGVAGEHYPCKPAIFESTYEPVETTTDA